MSKAAEHLSQQELESYLWGAANLLRGLVDAGDYKQPPRLRRVWIDRADLDRAIADWKERGER